MTQPSEQTNAGLAQSVPPVDLARLAGEPPSPSSRVPNRKATASLLPAEIPSLHFSSSDPELPKVRAPPISRSQSAVRTQSNERASISRSASGLSTPLSTQHEEYRRIILSSFAPRVAVYASPDTEEFMRLKGFKDGLYGLLRPYGENLPGRVIIRDSVGGSRGWDDFSIRFVDSKALQESFGSSAGAYRKEAINGQLLNGSIAEGQKLQGSDRTIAVEAYLEKCVEGEDEPPGEEYFESASSLLQAADTPSPLYLKYLRKVLWSIPIGPHETFAHPVTCIIAVNSRNPDPVEALRQLYASTNRGSNGIPAWMYTECLRYYVLVHDEENDDITKSSLVFDQMKRHFGLHCHLLRLRSSECIPTDDDSAQIPVTEWLSAEEEILEMRSRDDTDNLETAGRYIFESDVAAVKALLRELVTQSLVPFMESRVTTWNDQVASRRRGLSGRFMSLSKRWTGFGSTRGSSSALGGQGGGSSSNYDVQNGFYPPDTSEAIMRQLGDYAFMLRDWKLAYSTYDVVRTDYAHDKAWKYHAAANEMAAVTSLLNPQMLGSRQRSENIDQLIDTAAYSYLTRCSTPSGAIRCLTLALELLPNRGLKYADDAARWGGRLLELNVLRPIEQTLTAERIAECYSSRIQSTSSVAASSTRRRQAALWNVLASHSWMRLDKPVQARHRLHTANVLYGSTRCENKDLPFPSMRPLWEKLAVAGNPHRLSTSTNPTFEDRDSDPSSMVVEKEQLGVLPGPIVDGATDSPGFIPRSMNRLSIQSNRADSDGFE